MAVEGASTSRVFETYVERLLAPALLRPGQVVVMDNLGAHRPRRRIRELIEERSSQPLSSMSSLLSGSQPDRRSPLEDKAHPPEDRGPHQGVALIEAIARALAAP